MPILNQEIKDQVRGVFSVLNSNYELLIVSSKGHASYDEMYELLSDLTTCSDKLSLSVEESEEENFLSLKIFKDSVEASFSFEAVPNGHEFSTLLIAIMNLDGKGKNVPEEEIVERIKALVGTTEIASYISLSCTKCPDVVQAINLISIINPNIRHRIVDGALVPELMKTLSVQAIPTIYSDNAVFKVGAVSLIDIVVALEEKLGTTYVQEQKNLSYDVVVLGAGPAGATSAVYAARKGFKVAIVTDRVGGQTLDTQDIENISSHKIITGKEYSAKLYEQLQHYPIDIFDSRKVESFELLEDGSKKIVTSMNEHLSSKAMIIATGAKWRTLNIEGEADYLGKGIAFCTHCDAPLYKGKSVVVVGAGNSGLEAAIDLANIAREVTVLEFLDEIRGDKVLQDKLATMSNVKIHTGVETTSIKGDGHSLKGVTYKNRETHKLYEIATDGVFIQIGLKANSDLFAGVLDLTKQGEIIVDATCRTSVAGIYAAGDVSTVPYKQVVIAQGEGAKAALSAFEDIIKGKL